ncbi:hypothetical protein [Mailhella massiliensis]|uniref:hypothetical protein n=1 Tax=Mailhella massiliensis TaxID=1903261 RepID=UPI00097D0269|nr:hypothetical protein [Mailhella massiliensis]
MRELGKNSSSESPLSHVPRLKSWDMGQTPEKRDNVRDKKRDKEHGFSLLALIKAKRQAKEAGQSVGQERDKPCPTRGTNDEILSHVEKAEIGNFLDTTQEADKRQEKTKEESLSIDDMTTEEIIAAVHEAFPDGAPVKYKSMPDWRKFCDAFPHCVRDDGAVCGFYQPDKACHCALFEMAFPNTGWWHMLKSKM